MSARLAGFFPSHASRITAAPAGASNHALHIHNNAPMNIQAGMQTPPLTYLFSPAWLFAPPSLLSPCIPPLSSFLS